MSDQARGLDVEIRGGEGVFRLVLTGELDLAALPTFEAATSRLYGDGTTAITVDLTGLGFIDSSGLAAIVHAAKLCERHGAEFSLLPGPPPVQRHFELTGLADLLPFRDDEPPSGARADVGSASES